MFLEDLARLQGARLGVVPQGVLSRATRLPDLALHQLLANILTENPPQASVPTAQLGEDSVKKMKKSLFGVGAASRIKMPNLEDFPGAEESGDQDFTAESFGISSSGGAEGSGPIRSPLRVSSGGASGIDRLRGQSMASLSSPNAFKFEFNGFKAPKREATSSPIKKNESTGSKGDDEEDASRGSRSIRMDSPVSSGASAASPTVKGAGSNLSAGNDSVIVDKEEDIMVLLKQMDERVSPPFILVYVSNFIDLRNLIWFLYNPCFLQMNIVRSLKRQCTISFLKDQESRRMQEEAQEKQRAASSMRASSEDTNPSLSSLLDNDLEAELERALPTENLLQKFINDAAGGPLTGKGGLNGEYGKAVSPQAEGIKGSRQELTKEEVPLKEDEKNALLSEWYSLTGKKPDNRASASSSDSKPSTSKPQQLPGLDTRPKNPKANLAAGQSQIHANAHEKTQTPASAKPILDAEVMSGTRRGEEDAYVAAVLRNLEIVSEKVKAAEAKMAKAVALARAGDPAAKAASAAANAQLEPLREQLAQLQLLQQSLRDLEEDEGVEEGSDDIGEGGLRGPSGSGNEREVQSELQVAEIVDQGSERVDQARGLTSKGPAAKPLVSVLPKPSVISGTPPAAAGRSWGSWGRNQRIKDADVALIKQQPFEMQSASSETSGVLQKSVGGSESGSTFDGSNAGSSYPETLLHRVQAPAGGDGDDNVTIVNKKAGEYMC